MGWNNGKERAIFDAKMEKQAKELREAGASEELIKELYEYDLNAFNRERAYAEKTVSLNAIMEKQGFRDEQGMNPLLEKNLEEFSTEMEIDHNSTYWWINEMEDPALLRAVLSMTKRQRELITLIVYKGYSQKAIAKMWRVSPSTISNWWGAICDVVAKYRFGNLS